MGTIRGLLFVFISASCLLASHAQKTVCTQEALADIVFLVDGSWSIGSENFQKIRDFLITLVNSLDVRLDKVRIGMVQYSNEPRMEFYLNSFQDKQEVLNYITTLPYKGGGTRTGLGLAFLLRQQFVEAAGSRAKEGVPQIAVVITDGQSQDDVEPFAREMKQQGIILYAIGIKDADMKQLKEIATDPHDHHIYNVDDFTALQEISQGFIQVLCTTVEEVKRQVSQVPQGCKANLADIVFLVDGSSSIGDDNFLKVKQFLHTFIMGLDLRPNKVRVGVVQFSNDPHTEILIGDYTDKNDLQVKLDKIVYRKGGTETGKALRFIQDSYFTKAHDSRAMQNVPQILVVVTDGDSADDMKMPSKNLRKQGFLIFTVGIGSVDMKELQFIANKPHERFVISFDNYQELLKATGSTMDKVCVSMEDQQQALAPKLSDVFVLVDSSAEQLQQVTQILIRLATQLNVGSASNRMALAQFSEDVSVEFLFNAYKTRNEALALIRKFQIRSTGEPRKLGKAMDYIRGQILNTTSGSRIAHGYKQYLLVLSSGESIDSTARAVRTLQKEGVTIINVDLRKEITTTEIVLPRTSSDSPPVERTVIAPPQKTFYTASRSVGEIAQDVRTVIETKEVLNVTGECKSAQLADIVFILDVSDSVTMDNFKLVRSFLQRIISGLDMKSKGVRVGMVLYSDTPKAEFYLNTFDDKDDILQYVGILPYRGGKAYTGKALKFAREKVFSKELGSRRAFGVQQIAVIITDGTSEDNVTTEALKLRRSGVQVYALGITGINVKQLTEIASYPARRFVFSVESFARLRNMDKILRNTLCNNVVQSTAVKTNTYNLKQGCKQTEEADIYFLIDHSGSINPPDFEEMKRFILEFLLVFTIGPNRVRVGVVKFADTPTLEFTVMEYKDRTSIEKAVNDIVQIGGGTETGKGLTFMGPLFKKAKETRSHKVPEILIVITDGESQDRVKEPADKLREQGVSIYAIGVKAANEPELLEIADNSKKMFFVTNFDALTPLKTEIIADICSEEACKDMLADIIFLVDGSGSIAPQDFQKMKRFMNALVSEFIIGSKSVQVGVTQFSSYPLDVLGLNSVHDKQQIQDAINGMQQLGQNTLMGHALRSLSSSFDPSMGGRPGAPQFLILITDGKAQDEVSLPAKALKDKGIIIYSIGVEHADHAQLSQISLPTGHVYMERDFDALEFLREDLQLKICTSADECPKSQVADVVFLVDGSYSIAEKDFESMKVFMNSVVKTTQVGQDNVRFCTIVYSDTPQVHFLLNQYDSTKQVQAAISALRSPGGNTYTGKALQYCLQHFGPDSGGRAKQGVPQLLFVITDGEATDPEDLPKASNDLHSRGVSVYGIGVASAKRSELEIITRDKSKVFQVDDYEALKALQRNISSAICNNTKLECTKQSADLVILIDGSESIKSQPWKIMINFLLSLVDSLRIREDLFRIGIAQFSTGYRKEFYLNEFKDADAVKKAIQDIKQMKDGTYIGAALTKVQEFFQADKGSRLQSGISQNLLLITDGESTDEVQDAAEKLRAKGIGILAVGIGEISQEQLRQIAKDRVFLLDNFDHLKLNTTTQKVIDILCNDQEPPETASSCTVEIGIGFDISRVRTSSQSLFTGQFQLQVHLPEIIRHVSKLYNVCCIDKPTLETRTGFRLVDRGGKILYDTNFETYSDDVLNKVMALQLSQPLAFNPQLLHSFQDKFAHSIVGAKVLIIFTDGLDASVEDLRLASENLRKSGVHALLTVALEGVQSISELQKVEFGRGFGYSEPLSIAMQSVASAVQKQIDSVTSRECCHVMCKCAGHEGTRGPRGPAGLKGSPGQRGYSGYPGDEGGSGDRGLPGLNGTQGHQGCPGRRGLKGGRGYRGDMGEHGEHGLDGVDGEQGDTGSAGAAGEKGDSGSPGMTGVKGIPGIPGDKGLRGDPGESGSDSSIRGPKGDHGNTGLQGEAGPDGSPGTSGDAGKPGPRGRRGPPGQPGTRGPEGAPGLQGTPGTPGPVGLIGPSGVPGQKGFPGLPGRQGAPGSPGGPGSKGNIGSRGPKGQPGDPGDKGARGPAGPRGLPGNDGPDGYGVVGPKGPKGDIGFPGYPGLQGERGNPGANGSNGKKGNSGRGGNAGRRGLPGQPGNDGPVGHRGPKGPRGSRARSTCELITYVRDNCVCCKDNAMCPAYPTELVIGLDMSNDVSPALFARMLSSVTSLLDSINIAESNCPSGARVSVVSYSSNTKYLIRFTDYHRKKDLMEAVRNIALERTSNRRDIGAAMRFVGRNVFKRVRQGVLMRKVAVFLSGGQSQDASSIVTAVLEYKGLDINLGVIGFRDTPNVRRAFEADETGSFILSVLERPQDQKRALERIQNCVVCFDPCKPAAECPSTGQVSVPQEVDMDLALLVDGSQSIQADQYAGVKQVLGTVLDQLIVSSEPSRADSHTRVSLYQQSSAYSEAQAPVKQIFTFQQYQNRGQMKQSIFQNLEQTGGSSRLGPALEFIVMRGLLTVSKPRTRKMVLAIVGEEDYYDRAKLDMISKLAKCQGVVLFTLTIGDRFNCTQVEELVSFPIEQHIVNLGHVKQGEQEYAKRFIRTFFHILKREMNVYPPPLLRKQCETRQQQGQINHEVFEGAERIPIERIPLPTVFYPVEEEEGNEEEQKEVTEYTVDRGVDTGYENVNLLPAGRGDSNAQCLLHLDEGILCGDYMQRWYYDIAKDACTPFWYGGCGGNINRFNTELTCIEACITHRPTIEEETDLEIKALEGTGNFDVCFLKSEEGPCRSYVPKWFYNVQQSKCSHFWYGGCKGNGNRFDTREECEAKCGRLHTVQ